MYLDRELVIRILVLLNRLERLGRSLDFILDQGASEHVPISWLTNETCEVRSALEDQLVDAPSA